MAMPNPQMVQYYIDTRPLWPVPKQLNSRDEVSQLKTVAAHELSLLPKEEQDSVLRYYRLSDAKTQLASHLLKHFFITQHSPSLPWSESSYSKAPTGKPYYQSPSTSQRLEFNVSHQAGLVSFIGAAGFADKVSVGTDVVCVKEREKPDWESVGKAGLFKWIDSHAEVFAASELSEMRLGAPPLSQVLAPTLASRIRRTGFTNDYLSRCQWPDQNVTVKAEHVGDEEEDVVIKGKDVVAAKIRRFYAFWCLREAYVKMSGEGLAAPWLKELEIWGVRVPEPAVSKDDLAEGETVSGFGVSFKGRQVTGVKMELTAVGDQYMFASAVWMSRGVAERGVQLCPWTRLQLEDILALADVRGYPRQKPS